MDPGSFRVFMGELDDRGLLDYKYRAKAPFHCSFLLSSVLLHIPHSFYPLLLQALHSFLHISRCVHQSFLPLWLLLAAALLKRWSESLLVLLLGKSHLLVVYLLALGIHPSLHLRLRIGDRRCWKDIFHPAIKAEFDFDASSTNTLIELPVVDLLLQLSQRILLSSRHGSLILPLVLLFLIKSRLCLHAMLPGN